MIYSPIPPGHRAIPINEAGSSTNLGWSAAVLVQCKAEAPAQLVMLSNLPDSRAYLGCLLDGTGMVRLWLEIWVQNTEGLVTTEAGIERSVSNEFLDRRWQRRWQDLRMSSPAWFLFEIPRDQAKPIYLDVASGKPVAPKHPEGSTWTLERDDLQLEAAGLPKYSLSPWRYLQASSTPSSPKRHFIATDRRAPTSNDCRPPSPELGFNPAWLPLNPQGSPLAVCVHPSLDLEDYVDLLNGATLTDAGARKREVESGLLLSSLALASQDGRRHGLLLSDNNGAELLYLKLKLFLQVSRALSSQLRQHQSPLFNLDPASTGVLCPPPGDLPWAWMTTCHLIRPGRAFPLAIPDTAEVRFIPLGQSGQPAYCPAGLARRGNLSVTIWVEHVEIGSENRTHLEGRITTQSPVPVNPSDLLHFRLSEGPYTDSLFGTVIQAEAESRQEIEFRTWPRALTPSQATELKTFEGGKLTLCWCEIIPTLSSPYDFYSLSVLGARLFLSHRTNPLAKVVGELERLGRSASKLLPGNAPADRIAEVVERLLAEGAGGSHLSVKNLFGQLPDAATLTATIPSRMWAETIAILLRLMPGLGAVSQCADLGAVPSNGLHAPIEEPIQELESLSARTRSLLFSDWAFNEEAKTLLAELKDSV